MARTLSTTLKQAINAESTSEVLLPLVTIDPSGSPLRFVDNGANITSNGDTFTASAFMIDIPPEQERNIPRAELVIQNVDQSIIQTARALTSEVDVDLSIVLASDPDTVEIGPISFKLKAIEYDRLFIVAELAFEDVLSDTYPSINFTPDHFPGLF